MRKRFLPLLALVALASCTQNEMDLKEANNGQVPIMLGANALSIDASSVTRTPFEGTIGAGNNLTAMVLASKTTNSYVTRYAEGCMTFTDETTDVEYITDNTTTPAVAFDGDSYYPANGDMLYFVALYPAKLNPATAAGWVVNTNTSEYTFDGCTDVMAAAQVSGDKTAHAAATTPTPVTSTIPTFAFNHLLTKLNLKFKADDQAAIDAWGKISKIELIKAGGNNSVNTKVTVTLLNGTATTPSAFSMGTTTFKCYGLTEDASNVKTYTDTEYVTQTYDLTTTSTYQAYTLAAPIIADGSEDYTFKVYAANAQGGSMEVPVDLKRTVSGTTTLFTGDTQGKAFDITLLFKAKTITAIAAVTGWNVTDIDNDDTVIE